MVKIKGWIKIDNSSIKSKSWIFAEYATPYTMRKRQAHILVYDDRKAGYGWRVYLESKTGLEVYKSFKSKKEAMAWVIDYMRSHPNG